MTPSNQTHTVWQQLQTAGLVSDDEPPISETPTPWFVKILSALSGWLAALFLFAFIGLGFAGLINNSFACFIVGAGLIAGAFAVLLANKGEFTDHLAMAGSFAGQCLVIWALANNFDNFGWWLSMAILHTALSLTMPHALHRLLSALLAAASVAMVFYFAGVAAFFPGLGLLAFIWLWLHEFSFEQQLVRITPAAYALSIAGVVYTTIALWHWPHDWLRSDVISPEAANWIHAVLGLVSLLYLCWTLLQRANKPIHSRPAMAALFGSFLLGIAAYYIQGLAISSALLILGFAVHNRLLLGLGAASLLLFVSSYYYWLEMSLLAKSQVLLGLGLGLLLLRWLMPWALRETAND